MFSLSLVVVSLAVVAATAALVAPAADLSVPATGFGCLGLITAVIDRTPAVVVAALAGVLLALAARERCTRHHAAEAPAPR